MKCDFYFCFLITNVLKQSACQIVMHFGQIVLMKSGILCDVLKSVLYFSFCSEYVMQLHFQHTGDCMSCTSWYTVYLVYLPILLSICSNSQTQFPTSSYFCHSYSLHDVFFFFFNVTVSGLTSRWTEMSLTSSERMRRRCLSRQPVHREREEIWGKTCLFLNTVSCRQILFVHKVYCYNFFRRRAAVRVLT